jgi:hypothetical protein
MPAPTRPLLIRTAHFLDKLRLETGLGAPTLYARIAENQYRRHNLPPPSFETVRDLFRLRAVGPTVLIMVMRWLASAASSERNYINYPRKWR